MANRTRIRLAAAVAAMLSASVFATPALADQVTNFPGGYVHSWKGDHGEDFTVVHSNNSGQSVTTVNRHDGKGPVPFVTPAKLPITKKFGGSAYNPDTNETTTIVVGPTFRGSTIEDGNRLADHDFWWPGQAVGRSRGTSYNPATDRTTTEKWTPEGFMQTVEDGNTMHDHEDMVMRRDKPKMAGGGMPGGGGAGGGGKKPIKPWHASGSAFDPDTGMTTTIDRGPNGSMTMVENGNTLFRH
jgi:hypothetical protein